MIVADARKILATRCRDTMVLLGLDPSPPGPAVPSADAMAVLDEAIIDGMQACGLQPATPTTVYDSDLVLLPRAEEPKFKDAAWLRLLRTLRDRARSRSDQTTGLDSYKFGDVARGLETTIQAEQKLWDQRYIAGSQSVAVGPLDDRYRTPGSYPCGVAADPYGWRQPWPR